ncbi:MAG: hypothetical protein R3F48_15155 [Candidatus Zixiibacteriota bacterium]
MKHVLFCLIGLMIVLTGCSSSSDPTAPVNFAGGSVLLGLTGAHELRYVIYDSTITYLPVYSVTVDTTEVTMQITPGQNSTYELGIDGDAHDLLTVDAIGVLHSGQILPDAIPEDTLIFYPTPVLMRQSLTVGAINAVTSPYYMDNGTARRMSLFFLNYGYHTLRKFVGQSQIVVPIASYNAYHFQTALMLDENATDTVMTCDEYYAPNVGLVKMEARAPGSHRLIILLEDD